MCLSKEKLYFRYDFQIILNPTFRIQKHSSIPDNYSLINHSFVDKNFEKNISGLVENLTKMIIFYYFYLS